SANADSLCQGETLTVNAQTSGTVSWEADFDLTNIDNLNIIGTPSVSGWIAANATAVGSCPARDSLEIIVLELPQVNAGANLQTCAGVAVQLNGSASGNFAWIANPTLSATDVLNPTVNTLTDAVYYLQASTPFGCIASDSVQVEISGSVQADAGNDTTICSGTLLTLNASGGNTYSWNNAMLLNDSGIANPVATITNNTEFVVSVSLNGACEATDTVRVNVFEITIPSLSEGGIACGAPGIELGITGVASAQWNPSLGVLDPNALSTFANPNDSTFYTANYIDFNGCNGVSSPILVVPGESAQSGFSWEQISNFVVVFESTNAQPGQTVSWLINNQVITGDSVAFNFPFESEWTVTQIVENTCGSDTLTELIEVVKLAGYDALGVQPLEIFPNPAVNFVKIILSDQAEDASNLTVYSSTGAVVAVLEQLPSESIVLPVENWDSGVYEIRYTSRNTIKSARFIKQ
ncbi:MAG: T9SS type A sorting domain-containing protein, partial [Bacteroidia bacterium]